MPLHLPIMLFVRVARKGVDKLDEIASVGDPLYHERCKDKHFIPKLPFVAKNGVMKLVGKGPELSPEEEEAWHSAAAASRAEAGAAAAAAAELKRERKAEERAAKQAAKQQRKADKDAQKAARRAEKEQRRAAKRGA